MSGRKLGVYVGLPLAGGIGYYLYQAGGDPKVAEKQFEYDASKLTRKAKSELPGSAKEAQKGISLTAEQAGQKFDRAVEDAKVQTSKIDAKLESYRANAEQKIGDYGAQAKKDVNSAINTFDKTVEKKAGEAKGWFGGWFGGK